MIARSTPTCDFPISSRIKEIVWPMRWIIIFIKFCAKLCSPGVLMWTFILASGWYVTSSTSRVSWYWLYRLTFLVRLRFKPNHASWLLERKSLQMTKDDSMCGRLGKGGVEEIFSGGREAEGIMSRHLGGAGWVHPEIKIAILQLVAAWRILYLDPAKGTYYHGVASVPLPALEDPLMSCIPLPKSSIVGRGLQLTQISIFE